ncbi:MAG: hypothetical protein ABIK36_15990 [Pseudomonadota bacterium]
MSGWNGTSNWESGIDWNLVIERNVRLLGPIVATLCIMAGLPVSSPRWARREAVAAGYEKPQNGLFERPSARSHSGGPGSARLASSSPRWGEDGPARRGAAEALAGPGEGDLSPTLPRRVHRAVYRLLRAAEAAVRRLIIVVGRDMVAAAPALPPVQPKRGPLVTHVPIVVPGLGLALGPAAAETPAQPTAQRKLSFPLLDPLPDPDAPPFHIRSSGVPRISIPGWTPLFAIAPKHDPSPNDPIDAGYLRLRLEALSRALGDLPRQAMRLARWRARCEALRKTGRAGSVSPLRPGRAYGLHRPGSPRREHEVDDVLRDLHYFAYEARRDTS